MRLPRLLFVLLLVFTALATHSAEAHPFHHWRHHYYHHHHVRHRYHPHQRFAQAEFGFGFHTPFGGFSTREALEAPGGERPRDCYGIPWCGCWLRHYLHIPSASFNLALHWLTWGHRASGPGFHVVVVWSHGHGHGHVGIIVSDHPDSRGRWLLLSGNDGTGNHAAARWRSMRGAVGFRTQD